MKKRRRGLGSLGVDALLSSKTHSATPDEGNVNQQEFARIGVERIRPNRYQPRIKMDEDMLNELAATIKAQGVLQPLIVRQLKGRKGEYELIAGERRWRAAQRAGLEHVPVIIRESEEREAALLALIENIQRMDLSPLEEASALQNTVETFHITHEEVADLVGRSRPAVTNLIRLLELDPNVQRMLHEGELEMGQARVLLRLKKKQQLAVARTIHRRGMTVRGAEAYVAKLLREPSSDKGDSRTPPEIAALEDRLQNYLGTPVRFEHRKSGQGRLVIRYADLDVLDGILEKIGA